MPMPVPNFTAVTCVGEVSQYVHVLHWLTQELQILSRTKTDSRLQTDIFLLRKLTSITTNHKRQQTQSSSCCAIYSQ